MAATYSYNTKYEQNNFHREFLTEKECADFYEGKTMIKIKLEP